MSQQFCLKWNNHRNMMEEFKRFLSFGIMVDVTLACDGQSLKAHKIVLSACSPFFRSLFLENPCKHPIVILKDIKYTELKAVIDFMYCGEVNVAEDQLSALIKTARTLKVKGLGEEPPECRRNDRPSYEYENQSGHESENQSEDELSNMSTRTVEVSNETFVKSRTVTDQNENFEPEIKQEISDDVYHSASNPGVVTVPLFSHPHNLNFSNSRQEQLDEQSNGRCTVEESFQDSMQNLVGKSDSFLTQSFGSFLQSNILQHENYRDSSSSSITETSTYVYPSNTVTVDDKKPSTSSVSPHKNHQKEEQLEKIPLRKSVRQPHDLQPEVISNCESNSRKVPDKIIDTGSANSKNKFYKCSKCSFKSLYVKNLQRHYKSNHEEKKKLYPCSLCTYKASRSDTLKKHIGRVHERKKPFKCEKCDFHSAEKGSVKRHMIAVHGKWKKFACLHCNYRSHRSDRLNSHLKIHRKKK